RPRRRRPQIRRPKSKEFQRVPGLLAISEVPNSKFQVPKNFRLHVPNQRLCADGTLKLEAWNFFGTRSLEFGDSSEPPEIPWSTEQESLSPRAVRRRPY